LDKTTQRVVKLLVQIQERFYYSTVPISLPILLRKSYDTALPTSIREKNAVVTELRIKYRIYYTLITVQTNRTTPAGVEFEIGYKPFISIIMFS
jgi:hypothetical protein